MAPCSSVRLSTSRRVRGSTSGVAGEIAAKPGLGDGGRRTACDHPAMAWTFKQQSDEHILVDHIHQRARGHGSVRAAPLRSGKGRVSFATVSSAGTTLKTQIQAQPRRLTRTDEHRRTMGYNLTISRTTLLRKTRSETRRHGLSVPPKQGAPPVQFWPSAPFRVGGHRCTI